ncbi:hypothetical protein LXL04_010086 [Taraxacum kok-saghyz]
MQSSLLCHPEPNQVQKMEQDEEFSSIKLEAKRRPSSDYIEKVKKDVTVSMREYKLLPDTLYLTISYIDRFLSVNLINRQRLQLLENTKKLALHTPTISVTSRITHTRSEDIVKMEADVLKTLKFEMGSPTVKTFLRRFTKIAQENYNVSAFLSYLQFVDFRIPNLQLEFLSYYLAELSLLDYGCIKFLPSMVAASVTFLSRFILKPSSHPWNVALEQQSGYTASDLKECFKCVSELLSPLVIPSSYFNSIKE